MYVKKLLGINHDDYDYRKVFYFFRSDKSPVSKQARGSEGETRQGAYHSL